MTKISQREDWRERRERKIKAAGAAALVSVGLLFLKFYAYHLSGSRAILSDALESIVNVIGASILLFVVSWASSPPDKDHPYGHGKFESLSSTFEGGAVLLAGIFIIIDSVSALFSSVVLEQLGVALAITSFAGLINGAAGLYLKRKGEVDKSRALQASGLHLLSDFWTSLAILLGLGLAHITGLFWLDPLLAIGVAFWLCREGLKVVKQSGAELLDAEDEQLLEKLTALFNQLQRPGLISLYSTRVLRSGDYHHVDIHVAVPEFWDIQTGHDFVTNFEKDLFEKYPFNGELHFHLEPCRALYCKHCPVSPCPIRQHPFQQLKSFTKEGIAQHEHR